MKNTTLEFKIHLAGLIAEQTWQNKRSVNLKKVNRNLSKLKHKEKKNLAEQLRDVGNTKWSKICNGS